MPRLNLLAAAWAVAATAAAPGLRLLLRVRQARGKEVPGRLAERRGIDGTPRPPGRLIWLHAASVGETMSILPVLPPLAEVAPTVLLTTGTVTSATLLAQRLDPALVGRVLHRFVPLDVPAWVARFLDHWQPDAAGFVESELWPNLLAACRVRHIPMVLINGRLSERSLARWRRVPRLAQHVLGEFASVQPRSETDAERLRALGCCRMSAPGDLKLAAPPLPVDETELQRLRELLAGRPVWFVASTHPGEESLVLSAHRALAAEHPLFVFFSDEPDWVADTLGELGLWYRLAGITFIGRSLLPPGGGQNPLEPARLGCAIAVGPYTSNFTDHVAMLRAAGALAVVRDVLELARWVDGLLRDPERLQAMREAASTAVGCQADLPRRTAAALLELLG